MIQEPRIRAYICLVIEVLAFPDTCSDVNVVSTDFLNRNGLSWDTNAAPTIRLPNNAQIKTLGTVRLSFRFDDEVDDFDLLFTVLDICVHDVVLGGRFLRQRGIFTNFLNRLTWFVRASLVDTPRVCLVDRPRQAVKGSINGYPVSAAPDTGSDVNLLSKNFALELSLPVDADPTSMITLEFIDGTTAITCGIVRDMEWRFDEDDDASRLMPSSPCPAKATPGVVRDWEFGTDASPTDTYLCHFYILEDLVTSIILSSDLLLGSNAFKACAQNFQVVEQIDELPSENPDLCLIRRKKERSSLRQFLSRSQHPSQANPIQSTLLGVWEAELQRRGDEADRIAELPPNERAAAQATETQRIQHWDAAHSVPQQGGLTSQNQSSGTGP